MSNFFHMHVRYEFSGIDTFWVRLFWGTSFFGTTFPRYDSSFLCMTFPGTTFPV